MSAPCKFARADEARKAGWVSRRHQNVTSREEAIQANEEKRKTFPVAVNRLKGTVGKRQMKRAKLPL